MLYPNDFTENQRHKSKITFSVNSSIWKQLLVSCHNHLGLLQKGKPFTLIVKLQRNYLSRKQKMSLQKSKGQNKITTKREQKLSKACRCVRFHLWEKKVEDADGGFTVCYCGKRKQQSFIIPGQIILSFTFDCQMINQANEPAINNE